MSLALSPGRGYEGTRVTVGWEESFFIGLGLGQGPE